MSGGNRLSRLINLTSFITVHETPQLVIHKVPSPASHGSISATLSSGAVHVPYLASSPDLPVKFSRLVAVLKNELPDIRKVLLGGKAEWPLLWTMDFIPRDRALANLTEGEEEEDWTLGEINASCPGLTTAPIEVFEAIAEALEQDILACRERQTRKEEGWFESIRRYWGWWTTVAAGAGSTSAPSGGGGTTATGSGN